ncbi:MAG: rhomboid family intramembrane serine protease [Gammaproteobacteria bacterium]|nr:MAG: rhomboid family intramembrane serine protease [Gammaproteobacteria bacterium]
MLSHTLIIIAITGVVSVLAFSNCKLRGQLIFYPPAIKQGQLYRLITYGFIHADGAHLLFNMFTLYFFGTAMEALYRPFFGGFGFVIFYLAALLVSILPDYWRHRHNSTYASLGASGAVSAVLFAYILVAPWQMLYLFAVIPIPAIVFAAAYIAYSIYAQKKAQDNINHGAHLWGAAFGVIATIVLYPGVVNHFIARLLNPLF